MSTQTNVSVSEDLVKTFKRAQSESYRIFHIKIEEETFVLGEAVKEAATASLDFKKASNYCTEDEACIILYREKSFTLPSPWIYISYVPENSDPSTKMIIATGKSSLVGALGSNAFGKHHEFSESNEVVWMNVQKTGDNFTAALSQREIEIRNINNEQEKLRNELITNTDKRPSSFVQVKLPLSEAAKEALDKLKTNVVNWVQLCISDSADGIDVVNTATVTQGNARNQIDENQPQFYLYNYNNAIVLIYFYPDKGASAQKGMVYSTSKAALSDTIKSYGISVVKKFDIRTLDEMNMNNLMSETTRSTSTAFRPTQNMFRNANPSSNNRSRSLSQNVPQGGVQSAFRLMNSTGDRKSLPKGVVIPPKGAW